MRTMMIGGLALALAGCGISREQYAAKESEAAKYQKLYDDQVTKSAALDVELTAAQARMKEIEEERAAAPAPAAAAPATPAAPVASADTGPQREQLSRALERHIRTGQVEITEGRGKLVVKVKDRILFPPGLAVLGKDGRKALDAVADAFKGLRDRSVTVTGYTDNARLAKPGPYKDNWELSTARAIAVVRYLAFKGVDPAMLGAGGYSQYRPVAPNDTAANRSLNRRIEIALSASDYVPPAVEAPRKAVPRR